MAHQGTFFGRPLTEDEAQVAARTPLAALHLPYRLAAALERRGFTDLHRLATATLTQFGSVDYFGPASYRAAVRKLEAILASVYPLAEMERGGLDAFVVRVRGILESFDERKRYILEKTSGLWDGRLVKQAELAPRLGISIARVQQLRGRAFDIIRDDLRAGSPEFEKALRSIYARILSAKHGMAGVHEWEHPTSPLYEGQEEACLAFAFLCRASGLQPERLVTVGLDGACYESAAVKYRRDKVVGAAKEMLLNAGRPLPIEHVRRVLAQENGLATDDGFLRRCVQISRELGIERSGAVGLRRWGFFDADDLRGMAHTALAALGRISSTDDVARKVEELYPWRAPVNRTSLYHALERHKEDFVLARHPGRFALKEWGVAELGRLKDFLADFIRRRGGSAKLSELVEAATERGFKASSVPTTLRANEQVFQLAGREEWALQAASNSRGNRRTR